MNTPRASSHRRVGSARGSVLVVVLVICLGLVSLTLVFGHAMLLSYRGADNALAGRQADMAVQGAEQYAEVLMTNVLQLGTFPDPATYQAAAVPVGEGQFWFIGEPGPADPADMPAFGLVDEASKLNLNSASLNMLELLPNMTPDLAQAILDWRNKPGASPASSATGTGTAAASSAGFSTSATKNAPFESVEELAQVNGGTDPSVLYGDDANLNHVQDPAEGAGGAGLGQFSPGLLEYVTVFSREPNMTADGRRRVNVTNLGKMPAISAVLASTFGAARARAIVTRFPRGTRVVSVLDFAIKGGLTDTELDQLTPEVCMSDAPYTVGLINVNTASAAVLACVPGLTPATASQLVTARAQLGGPSTNLAWIKPILGNSAAAIAARYLTTQSYQVSADVAAVGHHGRGYRRTLFVLDTSATIAGGGLPQIVYRRNLGGLGWALGSSVRQTVDAPPAGEGTAP